MTIDLEQTKERPRTTEVTSVPLAAGETKQLRNGDFSSIPSNQGVDRPYGRVVAEMAIPVDEAKDQLFALIAGIDSRTGQPLLLVTTKENQQILEAIARSGLSPNDLTYKTLMAQVISGSAVVPQGGSVVLGRDGEFASELGRTGVPKPHASRKNTTIRFTAPRQGEEPQVIVNDHSSNGTKVTRPAPTQAASGHREAAAAQIEQQETPELKKYQEEKAKLEAELAELRRREESQLADAIRQNPRMSQAAIADWRQRIEATIRFGVFRGTRAYNPSGNPKWHREQAYYDSFDKEGNIVRTYQRAEPEIGITGKPIAPGPYIVHRNPQAR